MRFQSKILPQELPDSFCAISDTSATAWMQEVEQCRSNCRRPSEKYPEKGRKSRPVSRVLSRTVIHLGCKSPCSSSNLPRNRAGHASVPLFDLAPGGVYPATPVTSCAVRSYRTFSPLPVTSDRRYIFCGTFRRLTPPRRYLAPCPMEPGLSSILSCDKTATAQPTLSISSIPHTYIDVMWLVFHNAMDGM